jgi:hypothetical protein
MENKDMNDNSRVWIYASNRRLTDDESSIVKQRANMFVEHWSAHGSSLLASVGFYENLFLVIIVDESKTKASGCSIDDSVHFVQELGKDVGVDFFDRKMVYYEMDGEICLAKLHEFWALRKAGRVTEDTLVYNHLITKLIDWKTAWKVPFKQTWHQEMWV